MESATTKTGKRKTAKTTNSKSTRTAKEKRLTHEQLLKIFNDTIYKKIDKNNNDIILEVQKCCIDVIKICASDIKKIRDALKEITEIKSEERILLMTELSSTTQMLKRSVDTFRAVQPEANKDISETILTELTQVRETLEHEIGKE